jgi:hypothetical protein
MCGPRKDLPNVNENLPVESELAMAIVLKSTRQAGYVNVAAAVKCAIAELQARRK